MKKTMYNFFPAVLLAGAFFLGIFPQEASALQKEYQLLKRLEDEEAAQVSIKPVVRPKAEFNALGKDPFRSPIEKKIIDRQGMQSQQQSLPVLTVKGIIWGSSLPQAIINDKVVKVGDTVDGVTVEGIEKSGVSVSFAGAIYELSAPAAGGKLEQKVGALGAVPAYLQSIYREEASSNYSNY